jgi:hypothetical protein
VRAIIPAGALPDGATVTLQQIASPAGNGELAIEVTSEPAFATDVDVSFAVDDLGNLAIAEKQDDGMWIAIDGRVDGDRAVVTMEAATSSARAIPLRLRRRLVRLRRVSIDPDVARVKKDAQVHFIARGVFSDDQCEATPSPLCFPRNDLGGWFLGAEPIVETRSLANSTGTWTLGGPGRIDAPRTAHIVRYTAPSSRPSVTEWPITFKHTSGPSASATIKFMDNRFELKFIYDGFEDGIGNNLLAAVHDELAVNVVIDELGHVTAIGQLHNATSMVSNLRPVEPGTSTAQTSPFELATITSAQFGNQVGFSAILSGETVYANTLVTFQSGESVAFPGGVAPTSITLFSSEPLPFDTLLSESTFVFPPTNWKMKVTPIE